MQMWTGRRSNVKRYKTSVQRGISVSVLFSLVMAASAFAQGPVYRFRAEGENASTYRYEVTASGCIE
jgi:hypothetical protein